MEGYELLAERLAHDPEAIVAFVRQVRVILSNDPSVNARILLDHINNNTWMEG